MMVATLRRPTEMLPNSAVEADVALAALGTTQLNARRSADEQPRAAALGAGAPSGTPGESSFRGLALRTPSVVGFRR